MTHSLPADPRDDDALIRARQEKLARWREEFGITGYGHRVDDIVSLAVARERFDRAAHDSHAAAVEAAAEGELAADDRPRALVSGRIVQHRAMGKLVFLVLRDASGDLQISISKADVDANAFKLAKKLDYGDIIVAEGPVGMTKKEEICVWATRIELHAKSLVPPPEKFHGLTDPELRYRHRYVDMYANPETLSKFQARSRIVSGIRRFLDDRGFLEVETPMMQPIAGGAAARPFVTHHNALDMALYMRIAPELYLKRLLVGGMPRVYEVNRNFRNEGVDRSHNPEFTTVEVYEAFGDSGTMLELTESLLHGLALSVAGPGSGDSGGDGLRLPFRDGAIDWSRPFPRAAYGDLFAEHVGFDMTDEGRVRTAAGERGLENAGALDHWLIVNHLFEAHAEPALDVSRPTFITDYPSAISPLTRPQEEHPHLAHRWELLAGGIELGTAYTELNDPEVQYEKLTEQLRGGDEEEATFRTLDEDFLHALRVGMPPAGGLGLGVDRIVMMMTDSSSIRDVILFPLMRPETDADDA